MANVQVEALSDRELFAIIRDGSPEPVDMRSYPMIAGPKNDGSAWGLIWGPKQTLTKYTWYFKVYLYRLAEPEAAKRGPPRSPCVH